MNYNLKTFEIITVSEKKNRKYHRGTGDTNHDYSNLNRAESNKFESCSRFDSCLVNVRSCCSDNS